MNEWTGTEMNSVQIFAAKHYAAGDMTHNVLDEEGKPRSRPNFPTGDTLFDFALSECEDVNLDNGEFEAFAGAAERMRNAAAQLEELAKALDDHTKTL